MSMAIAISLGWASRVTENKIQIEGIIIEVTFKRLAQEVDLTHAYVSVRLGVAGG